MPANTSPDNIQFPTAGDQIAPLNTVFQNLAQTAQSALSLRANFSYRWANAAARTGQTGMRSGDRGYQVDTAQWYERYGAVWAVPGPTNLSTATFTGQAIPNGGRLNVAQTVTVPAVPWARELTLRASQAVSNGNTVSSFLISGFTATAGALAQGINGGFNIILNFTSIHHTFGNLSLPANTASVVTLFFDGGGNNQSLTSANGSIFVTAPGP